MPICEIFGIKLLKDFIGKDSWTTLNLLPIDTDFFKLPVSRWEDSAGYNNAKKIFSNLPVVNDAAERALDLATEVNSKTARKEKKQLQAMCKVVKGTRKKLLDIVSSSQAVTKGALSEVVGGKITNHAVVQPHTMKPLQQTGIFIQTFP